MGVADEAFVFEVEVADSSWNCKNSVESVVDDFSVAGLDAFDFAGVGALVVVADFFGFVFVDEDAGGVADVCAEEHFALDVDECHGVSDVFVVGFFHF